MHSVRPGKPGSKAALVCRNRFQNHYFVVQGLHLANAHVHGKAGVLRYADGTATAFMGSVNESLSAWKLNYELLWEMPNNDGYLQLVGIMQKFIDQSISANTNYDPTRFPSGKVPMQQLLKDLLTAYKFGVKTLYYQNTRDGAEDAQDDLVPSIQDDGCESGACKI